MIRHLFSESRASVLCRPERCPLTVREAAVFLSASPLWSMARPLEQNGAVYRSQRTTFWWMRYRDRSGILRKESTGVNDWHAAQKKLRERLQARDGNTLDIVRKGEAINFGQWTDFFLENYSKPPIRELKTHNANLRAINILSLLLKPAESSM
jgi:hypothetical protein